MQPHAKRVLFVIPGLGGGGAEKACVNLLRAIDRRRIQPELCVFQAGGIFADRVPGDVPVHIVHARAAYDLRLPFKLARLCTALQPDAILSIQRYANSAVLQSRLLARRKVPVIVNEQNRIGFEFQQFGGGRFKRAMLKGLYPRASVITVISHGIAQELAQDYSIDPKRVRVIYNPIDLAALQDRSHSAPPHPWLAENDPPTLIAAGRLVPQKGFDLLLQALIRVKAERPVRLIVLGEGPNRSMLEKLRDDLGLRAVVEFPGFQSNIAAFYSRATAFVLSSRYEGFGNVLVEAMACGAPVISFRCPSGPDEIIEDEQSGLLVPPEDIAALSAAIRRVLDDRTLADRLRHGGLARAKSFDAPIIAAQYADLIESICAS